MSKKNHFGTCVVCGKRTNLTFEHVPPKATGNHSQQAIIETMSDNFTELLSKEDNWESVLEKANRRKTSQKGRGDYTLCSKCNNFFGAQYVKSYVPFSNELAYVFQQKNSEYAASSINNRIDVNLKLRINPFRFQKQVLSMLMSAGGGAFKEDFKDYLLDVSNTDFPADKFKIIMNGNLDQKIFSQTGQLISANLNGEQNMTNLIASIQSFPLGFSLIKIDKENYQKDFDNGIDITSWFKYSDSEHVISITLPTFVKSQPFPYQLTSK